MLKRAFRFLDPIVSSWLGICASCVILALSLGAVPLIEQEAHTLRYKLWPVQRQWTPTYVGLDGQDGIVRGTVAKCVEARYAPPPMAREDRPGGRTFDVVSSNAGRDRSWPADCVPREFGPWRVPDAVCKRVAFDYEHVIDGRQVTTRVGVIEFPCPKGEP